MSWSWSRALSLVVAAGYLVPLIVGAMGDPDVSMEDPAAWFVPLQFIGFLLLPLGCIWFSDAIGGYTGMGGTRPSITEESPGCVIAVVGWILLLLPVIVAVVPLLMS